MSTSASIALTDVSTPVVPPTRLEGASTPTLGAAVVGEADSTSAAVAAVAASAASPVSEQRNSPAMPVMAAPANNIPATVEPATSAPPTVPAAAGHAQVLLDALIPPPPVPTGSTPAETFENKTNPHFVVRSNPKPGAEARPGSADDIEEEFGWAIGSELEFLEEDWDGPVGDGLDEEEGRGGMAVARPIPGTT
ncbi:MAG: hypothetical protein ACKO6N_12680 [Myxococcota bacterium]